MTKQTSTPKVGGGSAEQLLPPPVFLVCPQVRALVRTSHDDLFVGDTVTVYLDDRTLALIDRGFFEVLDDGAP